MTSPTNWIIASRAQVSVGDVVMVADGRARITGVNPDNGRPILTYETGPLRGFAFPVHPQHIESKVSSA